jgi:hypothetical protein
LLDAELSPLNLKPPQGVSKHERVRNQKFMPANKKKYKMKSSDESENDEDQKKGWAQFLPYLKKSEMALSHLHQKTYFNSAQTLNQNEN